jgi:hypothetical protein
MKHALLAIAGFILIGIAIFLGLHDEFLASAVALLLGVFGIIRGGSRLLDSARAQWDAARGGE